MGKLDGKVAFVSGVARGQGRSHALTLAREGADIIGFDICEQIPSAPYPGSSTDDMAETQSMIESLGRKAVFSIADVRDYGAVEAAYKAGFAELGRCDFIIANAGIFAAGKFWEIELDAWQEMIDINLTGVWHTVRAATPTLIEQGEGGSIVITGSTEALKGMANTASYSAAKHGVTGLMRSMANDLGGYRIRVNTVNPTCVDTHMVQNDCVRSLFNPGVEVRTRENCADSYAAANILPVPWVEPQDVSNAVLYLCAEEGRYITGSTFTIDAGFVTK